MEKVLNQEEIDVMVRAARGGGAAQGGHPVQPWDIRASAHLGRDQVQAITQLHEGFARNLSNALSGYLRVAFGVALVSAEYLTYREFLQRLPDLTYLASFRLSPVDSIGVLQLDHTIAFPVIDLLLGGEGKAETPQRVTTEIEDEILKTVSTLICRELETAWQLLRLGFAFEQRHDVKQGHRLMPPEEKTLSLSFELTLEGTRGSLNLAFPAVVSNALLRKLAHEWSYRRRTATPETILRVRQRLLSATFSAHLELRQLLVSMRQVLNLQPGDVLGLTRGTTEPALLSVEGQPYYTAFPARCGERRAARLEAAPGKQEDQERKLA